MRVLVVSSWFPYPPIHGSKLRAYHLLRELAKRHSITLLSFAEPGEEQHGAGLSGICETVRTVPGNPFKPGRALSARSLFSPLPRSYVQTFSPKMQTLVDEAIGSHDAAIGLELGATVYLDRIHTIPRIFEEAEIGVIREQYTSQRQPLKRLRAGLTWWKLARFMRGLTDRFDSTTVVSDVERGHLVSIGCDSRRISVISNGVDASNLEVSADPRPSTLIYPGALTYPANYDAVHYFLSDIFPIVRKARPDATLTVTGSTDGVSLDGLPNRDGVTFTGHVPDVNTLIAQSEVCVVPLRIGGGTRLKIIQSMALGTPVVSTAKGAEGLAVAPEDNILIGDTPQQFAEHVLRLMGNSALRTRLATNGRSLVAERYTWDKIGSEFDRLVIDTVTRFGAPRSARAGRLAETRSE